MTLVNREDLALEGDLRYLASIGENWTRDECDMGQQPSIKSDRILNRILDEAQDPETGLALLAKYSGEATPKQVNKHLFWQFQFMQWRDWRAGDVLAVSRALTC